jgi:hypothetical protein
VSSSIGCCCCAVFVLLLTIIVFLPFIISKCHDDDLSLFQIHNSYNPLGDAHTTCRPHDWRYPPLIDEYNSIIDSLCKEYNVSYIDTNDIVGPLWDSGSDWCHQSQKVNQVENIYMLSKMIMDP